MWNRIWDKTKSIVSKYWPIIVIVGILAGLYLQSSNNSLQRRLLERNFNVLQSDVTAIKAEQRNLNKLNEQLIVHATRLDEWIVKYGPEIDKLGQFNLENRRELATIRADIKSTKTELSASVAGLKGDIKSLGTIQSINTEDGSIYNEMERRLKELAERYGIDITK